MSSLKLPDQFASIPRYPLSYSHPSPIHALPKLSNHVSKVNSAVKLFAKRDDQAGPLAAHGNKYRKFEYIVPDILSQRGITTLVTEGGPQSNHTVQVAGLARLLGLECLVLLHRGIGGLRKAIDKDAFLNTGNVQLNRILGADVRWTDDRDTGGAEGPLVPGVMEGLRERGMGYWISSGASLHPLGGLGYARCAFEIVEQERGMREAGILSGSGVFDYVFVACGSGSTVAGLIAGFKLIEKIGGPGARKIVGVLVSRKSRESQEDRILGIARRAGKLIGLEDGNIGPGDVVLDDRFVGEAYGICDEATKDTLDFVMKSEAMALDPVYTAKVMRGMLHVAANEIQLQEDKSVNVLFIHTGGQSALQAYADHLTPREQG